MERDDCSSEVSVAHIHRRDFSFVKQRSGRSGAGTLPLKVRRHPPRGKMALFGHYGS
jgi:hypothetical protein